MQGDIIYFIVGLATNFAIVEYALFTWIVIEGAHNCHQVEVQTGVALAITCEFCFCYKFWGLFL